MQTPIIAIEKVSFSYNRDIILKDVSLTVEPGDFMAIIGPNGSGKTTFLKLILGLLKPGQGTIHVADSSGSGPKAGIGYVPQNVHLNQNFPITALDVVLMGTFLPKNRWRRNNQKQDREKAMASLAKMSMADYAHRKIGELSGGQRQRVLIARALVMQPTLLLLDEPTASIDTKGQTQFFSLLSDLNSDVTILVVTHDLLVISRYVKSVACINKTLHYHRQTDFTGDMLETMYACSAEEICPVTMVRNPFQTIDSPDRRSR